MEKFEAAVPWFLNLCEERFECLLLYLSMEEVSLLKDVCESEGFKFEQGMCLVRLRDMRAA